MFEGKRRVRSSFLTVSTINWTTVKKTGNIWIGNSETKTFLDKNEGQG